MPRSLKFQINEIPGKSEVSRIAFYFLNDEQKLSRRTVRRCPDAISVGLWVAGILLSDKKAHQNCKMRDLITTDLPIVNHDGDNLPVIGVVNIQISSRFTIIIAYRLQMSSILTNFSAMTALQTLRQVNSNLQMTQNQVSSGLRVAKAKDNAAYWAISTTMTSDKSAVSAISDALGLGAAKIDTAYAGMSSVADILSKFKARLVAAMEDGVDKTEVQSELNQLKDQVLSVAQSSSFNGENLLDTDVSDIFDKNLNQASVVSSFVRSSGGGVAVQSTDFSLAQTSLFNSSGGGILQRDPRDLKTIGGLRFAYTSRGDGSDPMSTYAAGDTRGYSPSDQIFTFTGPITLGSTDTISFDVTVDADNPNAMYADNQLPGPFNLGQSTHIVIDKATVDAALSSSDGVIADYTDYKAVLSYAFQHTGTGADAYATNYWQWDPPDQRVTWSLIPNLIGINSDGRSGLDGSSIQISNVSSTVGTAGLADTAINWGERRSAMSLDFEPFQVYDGVVVSFNFGTDNSSSPYSFDKDYVNSVLGETDGKVSTSDDMATLLNSLINRSDVLIAADGAGSVSVKTDVNQDRLAGDKSSIGFTAVNVNIEPLATMNFMDIDITNSTSDNIERYLRYIEIVSQKVTQGAAVLGSLKNRIDAQTDFASKLSDSISSGVGRLVDTDMEEASAKLSAEQTQQQLAIQSLSIANQAPQNILALFRA